MSISLSKRSNGLKEAQNFALLASVAQLQDSDAHPSASTRYILDFCLIAD